MANSKHNPPNVCLNCLWEVQCRNSKQIKSCCSDYSPIQDDNFEDLYYIIILNESQEESNNQVLEMDGQV